MGKLRAVFVLALLTALGVQYHLYPLSYNNYGSGIDTINTASAQYAIVDSTQVALPAPLGGPNFDVSQVIAASKGSPKLESVLSQLVASYLTEGISGAETFAENHAVNLQDGRVRVIIEAKVGREQETVNEIESLGAAIETTYAELVQVKAHVSLLETLAGLTSVAFVRQPMLFHVLDRPVESEGAVLVGAKNWNSAGVKGRGVKVAVLDLGFAGYEKLLGSELPSNVVARSFRQDERIDLGNDDRPTGHGTAVAEIVYDMAPASELYLVNYITELEFEQAVNWLIEQKVKIISHSAGSPGQPQDGAGFADRVVNWAAGNGIIWVNAAGNQADEHYTGTFEDKNRNAWHDFFEGELYPIGIKTSRVGQQNVGLVRVVLTWDNWRDKDIDYDLFLFDRSRNLLVDAFGYPLYSANAQTGSQPPFEGISGLLLFSAPCEHDPLRDGCVVYVGIKKQGASRDAPFTLWTPYAQNSVKVREGSVVSPATAEGAWAVGAVDPLLGDLQDYSSQGPTWDGRIKPDLVAPTGVTTVTSGPRDNNKPDDYPGFTGTSASAPHVAGAAVLVWSTNVLMTAEEVKAFLQSRAQDLGPPGKDNRYGVGRLELGGTPRLVAAAGGEGSIPVQGGSGEFAFSVAKGETNGTEGWLTYAAPGLGTLQAVSVGALVIGLNEASFWGFGRFGDGQLYSFNVVVRKGDVSGQDRFGISIWNAASAQLIHSAESQLVLGSIRIVGDSPTPSSPPLPP